MHCVDVSGIRASMQCEWASPITEVLDYSTSNAVTWSYMQQNTVQFLLGTTLYIYARILGTKVANEV